MSYLNNLNQNIDNPFRLHTSTVHLSLVVLCGKYEWSFKALPIHILKRVVRILLVLLYVAQIID